MRPIEEFQRVRDGLFFWQGYDSSVKTNLGCCAVALEPGLIFVDPLPLAESALEELTSQSKPASILLTNANHERAAADFARRFSMPVFAHQEARDEVQADHWLADGETVFENARVIHLPGFAKGEIALHRGDCLFLGDALINAESHGFSMLPDKYCSNPKLARKSLEKLLPLPFELMLFAHGLPIVSGAHQRLETLLS